MLQVVARLSPFIKTTSGGLASSLDAACSTPAVEGIDNTVLMIHHKHYHQEPPLW